MPQRPRHRSAGRQYVVERLELRVLLSSNMPVKLPDAVTIIFHENKGGVVAAAPGPRFSRVVEAASAMPVGGAAPGLVPGDANGDGTVDSMDINIVAANWGTAGAAWSAGDFTGDGHVDSFDMNVIACHWLQTAPAPALYDWHQQIIQGVLNVWAPNPSDFGSTWTVTNPQELFGPDGVPNLEGVHQGGIADCYFLAAIGSIAQDRPTHLIQEVSADSSGGWQVTFQWKNPATGASQPVIFHTSRELSSSLQKEAYNEVWPLVMEKAFAAARTFNGTTATNTMASIGWGYAGDAMKFLGEPFTPVYTVGQENSWDFTQMAAARAANRPVLFHTSSTATTMVVSHVYVITSVWTDNAGAQMVSTYNPWGFYENRTIDDVMKNGAGVLVIANP